MKIILRIVALAALGLVVMTLLIYIMFPRRVPVLRTAVVKASVGQVKAALLKVDTWNRWAAWNRNDTAAHVTAVGMPDSVGYAYTWEGRTHGSLAIDKVTKTDTLIIMMRSGYFSPRRHVIALTRCATTVKRVAKNQIGTAAKGKELGDLDAVRIDWTEEFDTGFDPIRRVVALFYEENYGPELRGSLKRFAKQFGGILAQPNDKPERGDRPEDDYHPAANQRATENTTTAPHSSESHHSTSSDDTTAHYLESD